MIFFTGCIILTICNSAWNKKNYDNYGYIFEGGPSSKELTFKSFWSFWLMFNALIPLEIECALQIAKLIYTLYVGVDG